MDEAEKLRAAFVGMECKHGDGGVVKICLVCLGSKIAELEQERDELRERIAASLVRETEAQRERDTAEARAKDFAHFAGKDRDARDAAVARAEEAEAKVEMLRGTVRRAEDYQDAHHRGLAAALRRIRDLDPHLHYAGERAVQIARTALTDTPAPTPCPKCEELREALQNLSDGVTKFCEHEHDFYEWICDPNEEAIKVLADTPAPKGDDDGQP